MKRARGRLPGWPGKPSAGRRSTALGRALLVVLLACAATAADAASPPDRETLRAAEPLEAVIADLEAFVPAYLERESVPGVAVALVRDGRLAWVGSFGSANRWSRRSIRDDTIFEVASISKVLTAFIALRLVDQGRLGLDEPLDRYLPEPWLPPSEYRDEITLRHCLSHSAGFGHNTGSRDTLFAPGSRYSYSAIGISYVQEVVEAVSGKPLEPLAEDLLFGPLRMTSSSFGSPASWLGRAANGHLWAVVPAIVWAAVCLLSLLLVAAVGWPVVRLVTGRWRPSGRFVVGLGFTAPALAAIGLSALFARVDLAEFGWLIVLYGTASTALLVAAFVVASRLLGRLLPGRSRARAMAKVGVALVLLIVWTGVSIGLRNLPVPRGPAMPPHGAASARATPGDLARFLIELAEPTLLAPETGAALRTSQVRLDRDLSWGLGPGILHSEAGDALWQWGQHVDFQSLMIVYPESRFGAVVLTNSDLLKPDVAAVIAHRAVGGRIEPLLRALHLEYNYRPEGG